MFRFFLSNIKYDQTIHTFKDDIIITIYILVCLFNLAQTEKDQQNEEKDILYSNFNGQLSFKKFPLEYIVTLKFIIPPKYQIIINKNEYRS